MIKENEAVVMCIMNNDSLTGLVPVMFESGMNPDWFYIGPEEKDRIKVGNKYRFLTHPSGLCERFVKV
jgi:hypothetical protein